MSEKRMRGKVAAITGGGAGIGEAICERLASEGARVAVLDISLEGAEQTVASLGDGLALACDVTDPASVSDSVAAVVRDLGGLDLFVNNAGAVGLDHIRRVQGRLDQQAEERLEGPPTTPLDALVRLSDDEWDTMISIHLYGTFYGTRAAARAMAESGGAIVNMGSVCGLEGCVGHPHYSAAKAGVIGFTRSVAKELIVQGIRVNVIAPGFIDTSKNKGDLDARRRVEAARTPAGRLGRPEEVAATVAFLASDDTAFYVGATLSPNGGIVTAV